MGVKPTVVFLVDIVPVDVDESNVVERTVKVASEVVSAAVGDVAEEYFGVESTVALLVDIVSVDVLDSVDIYPVGFSVIVDVDPVDAEASVDV